MNKKIREIITMPIEVVNAKVHEIAFPDTPLAIHYQDWNSLVALLFKLDAVFIEFGSNYLTIKYRKWHRKKGYYFVTEDMILDPTPKEALRSIYISMVKERSK